MSFLSRTKVLDLALTILVYFRNVNGFRSFSNSTYSNCTGDNRCISDHSSVRFFIIGDFGGLPIWPYETVAQSTVASSMAKKGREKNTEFQLALGDNFYFTGVRSVDDQRFEESFEIIYNKGEALYKPWYVLLGNHDHFGNVSAQIEYSKKSQRWILPNLYYSIHYGLRDGTKVDFIMIDTVSLCGNTRDVTMAENFFEYIAAPETELDGPKDSEKAEMQWKWIEQQLKKSQHSDYIFLAGHYPVYSIASHGPTECLLKRLKPLLHKYRVSAYLSGHDHTLQRLNVSYFNWTVEYIVSGGASRTDRSTDHESSVPIGSLRFHYPNGWNPLSQLGFSRGAFIMADLNANRTRLDFFKGNGDHRYMFKITNRNNM